MTGHLSHSDSISLPRYKKHAPRLSLLPFEYDAPGAQLSPPRNVPDFQRDHITTPVASPGELKSAELRDGFFGSRLDVPNQRRKKSGTSKKTTPSNQRFPEFVPHHSRGSSSTSTWGQSSTSSATLAVADGGTCLVYPPRKISDTSMWFGHRKASDPAPKFTGDNKRRNFSRPSLVQIDYRESNPQEWILQEEVDRIQTPLSERKDSLMPSPLDILRKPSLGSLKTPLEVPGESISELQTPSPVHFSRSTSSLQIPFDLPRKDSSTLPWGVEDMTPHMMRDPRPSPSKYYSQMMGNPYEPNTLSPPIDEENEDYEEYEDIADDKFNADSWPLPIPAGKKKPKSQRFSELRLQLGALDMDGDSLKWARKDPMPYSYFLDEPESRYTKVKRASRSCWDRWSTRQIILASTALILVVILAVGLTVGLLMNKRPKGGPGLTPTWRPAIGNTWQIQLANSPVTRPTLRAQVYVIDLFNNNASDVENLHQMGRRVICYFSAGSYESWRPDAHKFVNTTLGNNMKNWTNETWIDTRSDSVRSIMSDRIQLAKDMGCDGIDPDNVDGYGASSNNGTGFPLTIDDGADYVRYLATAAHQLDVAIGLTNAPELINKTLDLVQWSLNESCELYGQCEKYQEFIQAGKPVFHVEYATNASAVVLKDACQGKTGETKHFSTLIKKLNLDEWAVECPYGDPAYGSD